MASDGNKPVAKKSNPAVLIGIIVVLLALLGGVLFIAKSKTSLTATAVTEETAAVTDGIPSTKAETTAPVSIDINAALSDRALGSPSAPVKISEHASFTCNHCAEFHKATFDKIKKEYIDTGKVQLVFSDFPLNAPAVHASMISRCLPNDKYFDFVHDLFITQADWAFAEDYLEKLKTKASASGLDEAHFQACINNTELQAGIVNRMKGVQQQWNINSTPSFVVNNRTTLSGALGYEEFKKIIEAELSGKRAEETAVPTETPAAEPVAAETPASTEPAHVATETPAETAEEPVVEDEATPDPTPEAEEGTGETPAAP